MKQSLFFDSGGAGQRAMSVMSYWIGINISIDIGGAGLHGDGNTTTT